MKKFSSLSFALAAMLAFSSAAAHATDFTFTATGTSFTGSGTLSTSGSSPYTITGATGTINGHAISLLPTGTFPSNDTPNDNLLYYIQGISSPYLDLDGFSVALAGTTEDVNFYFYSFNAVYVVYFGFGDGSTSENLSSFTIAPAPAVSSAPEPAPFVLLGTGVLSLAGVIRRRFRSTLSS